MKKALLAVVFSFFAILAFSQSSPDGSEGYYETEEISHDQPNISVYPNPATQFISIDRDDNVKSVLVFNLVGRKVKSFHDVQKNEQYDVSALPNGMYLIQVVDASDKVITTQRISKR